MKIKLLKLGVIFSAIFLIAGISTNGFADTDVGFVPAVEKEQVFTSNLESLGGLYVFKGMANTNRMLAKAKETDNTRLYSTDDCTDTDTVPCNGSLSTSTVTSMLNWPDPTPVPAKTASNSITCNVCHATEMMLRPG